VVHPPSKRGGRSPRQKGNRAEAAIVRFLQSKGLSAQRVPLSGAAGGRFAGDVCVDLLGISRTLEVKARARAFGSIYRWLANADLLIVRADRREPLCILPLWLASEIAAEAEGLARKDTKSEFASTRELSNA
jgi:hypothetical protein